MTKRNPDSEAAGEAVPAEIHQLLQQRATFREWLDRLGGLRGNFRPEVAERVREDYRSRLEQVESELSTHRAEIEATLAERRREVGELAERREAQAAELEEVELRHAVGELPERDWERRRREQEEGIAGLDGSIEERRRSVSELEAILADLAGEPSPRGAPVAGRSPDAAAVEERRVGDRRAEQAPARPAATETAAEETTAAEAGEEPEAAEEPVTAVEEGAAGEGAAEEAEGEDLLDELEFLDSLALEDAGRFDAVTRMLDEDEPPERRG